VIGRVWRIFRAEALKLRARPLGWSPLVLAAIGAWAAVGWQYLSVRAAALEGQTAFKVLPTAWWAMPSALKWGTLAGGLLLVIVAGMLLAEERELGTAKVVFSKPLRRAEVAIAKGLVLLLAAIAVVAIAFVVGLTFSGAIWGFGPVVDAAYPDFVYHTASAEVCTIDKVGWCMQRQSLLAAVLLVPPLFGVLMVTLLVSSLTRQTGVAVGLAFSVLLFGEATAWLMDDLAPWIVNSYIHFPVDTLVSYTTGESTRLWAERWALGPPKLWLGLMVSGGTALLTWAVSAGVVTLRPVLAWLVAPALALGLAARADAADVRFSIQDLRVDGQVWEVRPQDVDGDGARDLVAFVVRDGYSANPRRFLAFFYQKDGRYPTRADAMLEVPSTAVGRFVQDVLPESPGCEVGFLEAGGVRVIARGEDGFRGPGRMLLRDTGFFDMGSGNQLPSWDDLVTDVNGDGRLDVLFPRKNDAALWVSGAAGSGDEASAGDTGFRAVAHFPLRYRQTYGNRAQQLLLSRFLNVDARLGRPVLAQLDPGGRRDVVTFRERALEGWLQSEEGGFGRDPSWKVDVDLFSDEGEDADEINRIHAEVEDVDGDGFSELVLYRNVGNVGVFSSLRTQVLYFKGRPGGWNTKRPDQIVNLNGISIDPVLLDIDRDGKRDLLLSSLRTDLITNVKRALFSSVQVTYFVYRFDPERGAFSASPTFARDIDVDVEQLEGGGTVPLAYFWGDYNGDGLNDMLTLATEDEVTIYPGKVQEGGFFSEAKLDFPADGVVKLQLETSNSLWIEDLNGDGRHDMVFHYWADDYKSKERGKITAVLSR
jgi:hypothetical protein